jgi:hypothetical protein
MSVPPAHVMLATAVQRTRIQLTIQLEYVLTKLMQLPANSPLRNAIALEHYTTVMDLKNLHSDDIDGLSYNATIPPAAPNLLPVPNALRQILRIFISLLNCWMPQVGGLIDVTSILLADFNEYHVSGYDPNAPLNYQHNAVHQGAQAGGGGAPQANCATPAAELFNRGIKKDKDHYPKFKDDKNWDAFCQSVETTADIHGTSHVLDINYVIPVGMPEAFALFTHQNRLMYSVFESKIKNRYGNHPCL